jgi:class 3 adenylate cyclase
MKPTVKSDERIATSTSKSCGRDIENIFVRNDGNEVVGQAVKNATATTEEQHELAINVLRYAIIVVFAIETFEATIGNNGIHEFNYDRGLIWLTLLIFVIYDRLVAHEHKIANTTAAQSSSAIAAILPEHIRSRFYEYNKYAESRMNDEIPNNYNPSLPIADTYPACTLMFADIVGYTEWSSKHQPAEIMQLLETLYGAFDNIAKKYDVFKVETVGDCYVAATGLPNAQDDHAVILTIFATECMFKMKEVLQTLGDRLGLETENLSMRFGLNSGPVAGGILGGKTPRFQLFGDTVNTTARLESNGQQGRIHISQSTATFLIERGKSNWVIDRDELIDAKGKGIIQTYWVDLLEVAPHIPITRRRTM